MAFERDVPENTSRAAWWPAIGAHLGLLAVGFSAAWTIQPEGWFSRGEWAAFALIGLATLVAGLAGIRLGVRCPTGAGLLALAAATALYMAYDPQLGTLPGMGALAMGPLGAFEPSLAHLGASAAALFALLYFLLHPRPRPAVPFSGGVIAAALLLLALGGIMYLALHNVYDLSAASGLPALAFRIGSMALVMLAALVMSGARGVGPVAHIYLGAALLAAVARNLAGGES